MVFVRCSLPLAEWLDKQVAAGSPGVAEALHEMRDNFLMVALPVSNDKWPLASLTAVTRQQRETTFSALWRAMEEVRSYMEKNGRQKADVTVLSADVALQSAWDQFQDEYFLLIPVDFLRKVAAHAGMSLQALVTGEAFGVEGAGATTGGKEGVGSPFVICPRRLPPNPERKKKNERVKQINEVVDSMLYTQMTRGDSSSSAANAAAAASVFESVDSRLLTGRQKEILLESSGGQGRGLAEEFAACEKGGSNKKKESFAGFMRDISIGLDVRLMSIAGGVVGYYACYARGQGTDQCIVGAAVGAVFMLLVDGILLMIRLHREDEKKKKSIAQFSRAGGRARKEKREEAIEEKKKSR